MKAREVLQKLKKQGLYVVDTKGSHVQLKHDTIPGRVTVPGHGGTEIPAGTLGSIYRQARWKP